MSHLFLKKTKILLRIIGQSASYQIFKILEKVMEK